MVNQRNTVRVFVVASSGPIRRSLLRMFDDIPVVELVGVTSRKFVSPQGLAELAPDLLLLNPAPDKDARHRLFDYLSQHLPGCKTVFLSKPSESEAGMGNAASVRKAPASTVIDPDDQIHLRAEIQKSIIAKSRKSVSRQVPVPDGTAGYLYDYIESLSGKGRIVPPPASLSDITERRRRHAGRRQAELNRAESIARLQSFVEQLPGMAYIAKLDNDGSPIYISPRINEVLGFSPQQWCGHPRLRTRQLHPDDRDRVLQALRTAVGTKTGYAIDYRIYRRDQNLRWVHDEASVVVDDSGIPLFLQGAMIDITERKQAQEELQRSHNDLQELICALDSLRVEEQKRLAHEMHDDFGQLLAAMKIDLCTLQRHLPSQNAEAVKYLSSINELVDAMVASVRRIIANLPPKVVEDLGLFNALQSMVKSFEKRHRIACRLSLSGLEPELDTRIATALFRMVQEALNNVAKHAEASSVNVHVDCLDAAIALAVSDNGKGLADDNLRKAGSFGLIGMRERATALGGEMSIESKEGEGTIIRIVIPIGTPRMQGFSR